MKNLRFLLWIFLLCPFTFVSSQNPYYDAVFLKEHTFLRNDTVFIKLDAMKRIADHLFNYLPELETGKHKNKEIPDTTIARLLRNGFSSNPFFSVARFVPPIKGKTPQVEKIAVNALRSISSNVSGLNVTTLADGFAKFLVDRVKEELSMAFFDHFKRDLKKNPDLQALFPYTYDVLQTLGDEIYNFTAYFDMLREAYLKDFQLIIPNLRTLIQNPRYKNYFNQNPDLNSIVLLAFQIVDDYQTEVHPGDMIAHLAVMDTSILNLIDPNLKPSFQVLDLFVQSIRSKITDQYTVPSDTVKKNLLNDSTAMKIYLGLIYQQSKNKEIKFNYANTTFDFSNIVDSLCTTAEKRRRILKKYKHLFEEILDKAENVQQTLALSEKEESTESKGNYKGHFGFYHASIDLLECISFIPDSIRQDTLHQFVWGRNKNTCFYVVNKLGEIYLDINELKYASAILNVAVVYDTIFSKRGKSKNVFNTGSLIIRYGNFAAIISKAETSDQVRRALETIALPAGSSRLKRGSAINIALNAYVSGYYGEEKFTFLKDNERRVQWRTTAGLSAPVGIGLSKGSDFPFGKKWRSSYTVFASIVDLGVFASFRFNDTINDIRPKIALENIFSPGLYFIYGVPKSPISIGGGLQYGPTLRKIEPSTATIEPRQYLKWCFFVGVDIPFMNFYSKPKR